MENFSLVKENSQNTQESFNNDDFLTFATICFSGEFANLLLQARSLSLYGNDVVKKWIIVINSEISDIDKNNILNSLRKELQGSRFCTFIAYRQDIIDLDLSNMHGSRSQQILKIYISSFIDDDFYVILDSKNHAIRHLKKSCFIENSKPIVHKEPYPAWNPFYKSFMNAFNLVGLEGDEKLFEKYQSTTPYVMKTNIVKECMNKKLFKNSRDWYYCIALDGDNENSITEFALYGAIFELYKEKSIFQRKKYVTLFDGYPNEHWKIMNFIKEFENENIFFFGVHRNKGGALNVEESIFLAEYWKKTGLFETVESGIFFLRQGLLSEYNLSK